jgi:O-methyltransferase
MTGASLDNSLRKTTMRNIAGKFRKGLNAFGYDIHRVEKRKIPFIKADEWCLRRFLYFKTLFDQITHIEGDIVECGVGRGETFYLLAILSMLEKGKGKGNSRNIWGFDSFEGFPEPTTEDDSIRKPQKDDWKNSTIQEDDLHETLLSHGLSRDFVSHRVKLVKGFFSTSLVHYTGEKIVFLHLDVDLYQSYKQTLELFWPKVAVGGVVLFDEYKQPGVEDAFPGAAKAIDEFLGVRVRGIQHDPSVRRYYIFKKE